MTYCELGTVEGDTVAVNDVDGEIPRFNEPATININVYQRDRGLPEGVEPVAIIATMTVRDAERLMMSLGAAVWAARHRAGDWK